ncbi:MAG: hypothetical protein AB1547_05920 [Thermodesulfobacteriota bacterium]
MHKAESTLFKLFVCLMALLGAGCSARHPPVADTSFSPSFYQTDIDKVAVLVESQGRLISRNLSYRYLEDDFITALMRKGYRVASRSDLKKLKIEVNFQHSGLTDFDAVQIGRMLNIPAIIVVSITSMDRIGHRTYNIQKYFCAIGARLISVEKGEVLWIGKIAGYGYATSENELIPGLLYSLAESFPPRQQR